MKNGNHLNTSENILLNILKNLINSSKFRYPTSFILALITVINLGSTRISSASFEQEENICPSELPLPENDIYSDKLYDFPNNNFYSSNIDYLKHPFFYHKTPTPLAEEANSESNFEENYESIEVEPTNEEKIEVILDREKMTEEQLIKCICIIMAEGGSEFYQECYDVASIPINRRHSRAFVDQTNGVLGENTGYNIYAQLITSGQFTGYKSKWYYIYLNMPLEELIALPGYQAVIDCFYSLEASHNYLSFKGKHYHDLEGKIQLNPPYGNYYHREMTPEDTIEEEDIVILPYGELARTLYKD